MHENRGNVVTALAKLQDKSRQKSETLDKIILLNRATDKIEELKKKDVVKDYDLIRELKDDESNIFQKLKEHLPLYRTFYPQWGKVPTEYLNCKNE